MTDSRNPVIGLAGIIAADYTYRVGSRRVKAKLMFSSVLGSITATYVHHARPADDPDNTGLSAILPGWTAPVASSLIPTSSGVFWSKMEANYWLSVDIGAVNWVPAPIMTP